MRALTSISLLVAAAAALKSPLTSEGPWEVLDGYAEMSWHHWWQMESEQDLTWYETNVFRLMEKDSWDRDHEVQWYWCDFN